MSIEEFASLKNGDIVHFKYNDTQLRPETYVVLSMFANVTMVKLCDISAYNRFGREKASIFSFIVGSRCARDMTRGYHRR